VLPVFSKSSGSEALSRRRASSNVCEGCHSDPAVAGEESRSDPERPGARDCTGRPGREASENLILAVDRVRLLADEGARV
jgi:hypothetical protein